MAKRKKRLLQISGFTVLLFLVVGFLIYQQLPADVTASQDSPDSDNCYACHSDPDMIQELASEEEVGGGGG